MKARGARVKNSVNDRRSRRSNIRKKAQKTKNTTASTNYTGLVSNKGKSTQDSLTRGNQGPFEYDPSTRSENSEDIQPQLAPKYSKKANSKTRKVRKPRKKSKKTRDYDQKTELIDLISECIKNKGTFDLESLTPEQLKLFQANHEMVQKMDKLGIAAPKVDIITETDKIQKSSQGQKYPGNNKPAEKFERKNRYGTFGDDPFDRMVDLYYNDPQYKKPKKDNFFHIEPYNERFHEADNHMSYVNLSKDKERQYEQENQRIKVEDYEEDYTSDHLKYEEELRLPKPDRKLMFSQQKPTPNSDLPGVINSQKRVDEIQFMQSKRRSDAASLIQRIYRGYKGRKIYKKELQKRNIRDQEDYGYFEVAEKGVRQFLADRKEKIADERLRAKAYQDLDQNEELFPDRFTRNFFEYEADPTNIFNIYKNRSNGKDAFATPERSFVTMAETPKKSTSKVRKQAIEKYNADLHEASSSIKESISGSLAPTQPTKKFSKSKKTSDDEYSNDFETDSIKESIVGGSADFKKSDKFQSYSDIAVSISAEKRGKKFSDKNSIRESIEEDIMEDSLANKGLVESIMSGKRPGKEYISTDSIREEISGSGFKNHSGRTPRIQESIPEELEGSDYSDNFESGSISKSNIAGQVSPKKNLFTSEKKEKYEPSMLETKEDILLRRRLEKKYGLDVPDKAENLIFDMINAKNLYENSTTGMHMVDKFERMVSKYEANIQIMNERNMRLQEENRLREEAQKIREDQISSLVALLLANKSSIDGADIGKVINEKSLPKEIQLRLEEQKKQHQAQVKKDKGKKIRFEEDYKSDSSSNPEVIKTGDASNTMSMFKKAPIKRTKPVTPRGEEPSLASKLKNQSESEEIDEPSLDSIPYSEDFEPDESLAVSKPKVLLKTKSDITEEIPEEYGPGDDDKEDTITEKIGDDYSMTFEDVSESIVHSKSLKPKESKFAKKSKLGSKYSTSRIEEESIAEEIEEDFERDDGQFSASSKSMKRSSTLGKPVRPKPVQKRLSTHDSGKSLLKKLKDTSMTEFIETLGKGIDAQYKEEYDKLVREFSSSKIDDYIFAQKKKCLDDWKAKELRDIQKKQMLIEGWIQMSDIVSKMKEEESLGHSSGSIMDLRKAPKLLFSKPDYSKIQGQEGSEDSEFNPDDDSDDSFGLRRAKKQLRDYYNHENEDDSADENIVDEAEIKMRKKAAKKKKVTAEKLMEEKEKAIQDGLRQRIIELDENHAQELLGEAVELDVKQEIERRFNLMLEIDSENLQERRRNEIHRQKRLEDSIEDSSLGHSFKPYKITESMETSQPENQNTSSKSLIDKVDKGDKKGRNSINKLVLPARSKDDPVLQSSIQEDAIQEELDAYSNDFGSISASASNIDPKVFKKLEEKEQNLTKPEEQETPEMGGKKASKLEPPVKSQNDEESEIPSEIIEDEYSENFDESMESSKLSNNIQDISKKPVDEIQEEESQDEDKQSTPRVGDVSPPDSDSLLDVTPVESEKEDAASQDDEFIQRVPTGKSDDFLQKVSDTESSVDHSVAEGSHQSVDWVIDSQEIENNKEKLKTIEEDKKDTDESKKKETEDDIDEDYISDFEDFSDPSKSGESTPKIGSDEKDKEVDIMDDHEKLADIIAEELFKSIESGGLYDKNQKILPKRDFGEEDFKDKFPFKKPLQPKTEKILELQPQLQFFNHLTAEILKPHNSRLILAKITSPPQIAPLSHLNSLRNASQSPEVTDLIPESLFRKASALCQGPNASQTLSHHNKALFDTFNQVFASLVPKQNPSNKYPFRHTQIGQNSVTHRDLQKILQRVNHKLVDIISTSEEGKKRLTSKPKNDEETPDKEAKRKTKVKEENLLGMIKKEFDQAENEWVGLEKEKAQVTFDVADRIMEQITEETAKLLGELEQKVKW